MKPHNASHGTERQLQVAVRSGVALDLRTHSSDDDNPSTGDQWPTSRQIKATAITEALLGSGEWTPGTIAIVHVIGARVIGNLDLRHAHIDRPLLLESCYFEQAIDLSHAHAESLSFNGSQIQALTAVDLRVTGSIDFTDVRGGQVDIFGSKIGGRLRLCSAQLESLRGVYALNAPDLTVDGGMYCRDLSAIGGVNLYGAAIGSSLEFDKATLTSPNGTALRAPNLTVKSDLTLIATTVAGTIDLFGAHIGGQLWLNGAQIDAIDGRHALNAPLLKVDGGAYCNSGFRARGCVNFYGASIGSTLEFDQATIMNPSGTALRAPDLTVKSDLICTDRFTTTGTINLSGAHIGGRFELSDTSSTDSVIDLRNANAQILQTDSSSQLHKLYLNGFTYSALEPYAPAHDRLNLLHLDPDDYQPQPYEQLASYYRQVGHDEEARTVLLAKQRRRRNRLRFPAKIWGYAQDIAIGYGYRPARAFGWLVLLITITATYFFLRPPAATSITSPQFQPLIYALNILIPVLDLGQKNTYAPSGVGQWVAWTVTIAGWVLATTVIASVTRALSRN